jgi:hypothetical protein
MILWKSRGFAWTQRVGKTLGKAVLMVRKAKQAE